MHVLGDSKVFLREYRCYLVVTMLKHRVCIQYIQCIITYLRNVCLGLKPWEWGEVDKALGRFGPLCGVVLMEDAWMQMPHQGRHTAQ